jgi:hypothetical protein
MVSPLPFITKVYSTLNEGFVNGAILPFDYSISAGTVPSNKKPALFKYGL